ncbi:MAG: response regulator [Nitrospirae bacterium]|nr:response regulator [Nitrospirota bacterium]
MEEFKELLEITKGLTVLYVEDERPFRFVNKLQRIFGNVILADNGNDGFEKFQHSDVDLVLTDYLMPEANGIDLIKMIRNVNRKTPIILITGYIESEFLIEAINLGVTQFVTKPILVYNLLKAIEIAVQQVVLENLAQKTQEQELELLRYREKYHSAQQEMAFLKELKIIKNDLYGRKIETIATMNGQDTLWYMDICYVPLDILSGDSYSIRELDTGKVLFFITDAMGKGLSASVTTILTTSFINHLLDETIVKKDFDLSAFLTSYTNFIKKELLSEEIICAAFVYVDFNEDVMETALYSMPPLLVLKDDGSLMRIKSNNLPIMRYLSTNFIERYDMSSFKKILIYSDGINESHVSGSTSLYQDHIERDFVQSTFTNDLYQLFVKRVEKTDDDVTFIYLHKLTSDTSTKATFTIDSTLKEVKSMTARIEDYLDHVSVDEESKSLFINSFTEILMNAYEHGNLNLNSMQKNELTMSGDYENFLLSLEKTVDKKIHITVNFTHGDTKDMVVVSVTDEGTGFELSRINENNGENYIFSGRGIKIAKTISDVLLYNKAGNEAVLIKTIDRGYIYGG